MGMNPYKSFLQNVKTVFLFSTPSLGSRGWLPLKRKHSDIGPLVEYLELLKREAARLNADFAKLRHQQGWKTIAICEANETRHSSSLVEASICGEAELLRIALIERAGWEQEAV
ncbi:hypothetical protein R1flu_017820 [Riccia fluitans]|uniref:Uncharacterized protein n=1 Tax=Riccia fluitans TaxID=41844 RepID=A0ABD1ZEA2_9MARC